LFFDVDKYDLGLLLPFYGQVIVSKFQGVM